MAFRGRGGRRGGFGDRGGRSYGNSRPMGPPDTVQDERVRHECDKIADEDRYLQEMGLFLHDCEGDLVCRGTDPTKVPQFSAQIYLENKTPIGKVDEVLGPLNGVLFTIKPSQGIQAASFKSGDRVYITPDRVLPLDRFLPKPKLLGQSRIKKKSRPGAPGGPSQRGRGRGAFRGRGVSTRGGSAHQGTNSGYGSFARGGARGSFRGQRGTSSRGGTRGTGHNNRGYSRTGGASQVRG